MALTQARAEVSQDVEHGGDESRFPCFGKIDDGALTVRFTYCGNTIRIFGAGYWLKGKAIHEKQNQIHQ